MADPFSWSLPLGRILGIRVRFHILFVLTALVVVLSTWFHPSELALPPGRLIDAFIVVLFLVSFVAWHEIGHCVAARTLDGDVASVTLWPLGGLDAVEVPLRARSVLIVAACGPLANLLLASGLGIVLYWMYQLQPPFSPGWSPFREAPDEQGAILAQLMSAGGIVKVHDWRAALLARAFWINWILLVANVLLPAFPLDGSRILQCLLWPRFGLRQATLATGYLGVLSMFGIGIYAVLARDFLVLCAALFIYRVIGSQMILLETGSEEAILTRGFILEPPALDERTSGRRRAGIWQRWLHRRAVQRIQREQALREAEEQRMDVLLDKVQQQGLDALSEDERRFLKRVSDRYRNRQ
jgi:Zn-dependent protease